MPFVFRNLFARPRYLQLWLTFSLAKLILKCNMDSFPLFEGPFKSVLRTIDFKYPDFIFFIFPEKWEIMVEKVFVRPYQTSKI